MNLIKSIKPFVLHCYVKINATYNSTCFFYGKNTILLPLKSFDKNNEIVLNYKKHYNESAFDSYIEKYNNCCYFYLVKNRIGLIGSSSLDEFKETFISL